MLDLLAGQPRPATAAELADEAGQHPNTVREHLDGLVDAGLATRERAPASGRGRPAWLYAAAPEGGSALTGSAGYAGYAGYAGLATALARQIARSSPRPTSDAQSAGQAWGAELAAGAAGEARSPAVARRQVVGLLGRLGFAPEADRRATRVRLPRCPLLETAREHPEVVCAVHLGIVRGALDTWGAPSDGTRLVPFAEPDACVLHLTAASRATAQPRGQSM